MNIRNIISNTLNGNRALLSIASLTFMTRAIGIGTAFLFNILIARFLGAEGAGLFFLGITALMVISILVRIGLDNAVMRFTSTAWEKLQYGKVLGYYITGLKLIVFIGIIVSILLFSFSDFVAVNIFNNPDMGIVLQSISYGVIPVTLIFYHSGLLRGVRSPVAAGFIDTMCTPFIAIAIITVMALNAYFYASPELAVNSYVVASVFANIAAIYLFLRYIPSGTINRVDAIDVKEFVSTAYPMMWVASLGIFITWFPTLYLGVTEDAISVGLYHVAFRTANTISFVLVVINSIAAPKFAVLYTDKNIAGIERVAVKCAFIALVAAFPLLIIFLIYPELILSLFGAEFIEANNLLRIMALGHYLSVVTGSLSILMMMSGHEVELKKIAFITACLSIILNLILIENYGAIGAAYAISISLVFQNLMAAVFVSRKLNIKVLPSVDYMRKLFST